MTSMAEFDIEAKCPRCQRLRKVFIGVLCQDCANEMAKNSVDLGQMNLSRSGRERILRPAKTRATMKTERLLGSSAPDQPEEQD